MKKLIEAPNFSNALVSQKEHDQIYNEVLQTLEQARANIRIMGAKHGVSADFGKENGADADRDAARGTAAAASSPSTNRGVKSEETRQVIGARLELEDGKILEIPARRTWGGSEAFLDWVNFTTDENDYMFGKACVTDEELIDRVSHYCKEIFGYGITSERETGANFYQRSFVLGDGYCMVCYGGQRNTVLVMVSGEGCTAAKNLWEQRLYDFLTQRCGVRAKLTRVDLAHDIYDGKLYNVDIADADYDAGRFNTGGRNPNHEQRGNWKRPSGKGRTLYIGNRDAGKYLRVYEKGRQLGDKNSEWNRVELEMKAIHRLIPFEVLLYPGRYLAAAYPALAWISEHQERILSVQKKTEISYQAICDFSKKQFGAMLNVIVAIEGSAQKAVAKIIRDAIPNRMKVPMWHFAGEAIHEQEKQQKYTREVFDNMALA